MLVCCTARAASPSYCTTRTSARNSSAQAASSRAWPRACSPTVSRMTVTATNLGVGRLQRAMLDLRAELARQEQEIVLLIEDFALVQGVQRDLLDAIIEPGVREGRQVLAPIRTLMAVTSGFFDRLADTVITRATAGTPYVYDLDAQFGDDISDDDITSFIGRYLNAARLGRDRLEHLMIRNAEEVPNACDQCAVRDACHRGFETSSEGHGLYPF